jgi:predicted transcriptional regulator YheO
VEHKNMVLTPADRLVLEAYGNLLDGLAQYLGNGYEIVLHSLEDLERSVVKIVNGHHTGRTVGAPITDLALSMLARITQQEGAPAISYFTQNRKGEPLKAATIAIQGENRRIIGLLCINFYLNTPFAQVLAAFTPPAAAPVRVIETFGENTAELVEEAVARTRLQVDTQAAIPVSMKNRQVVAILYRQGIFNIKNAVDLVAAAMGISKNTVYLHLRHIKEELAQLD